MINRIKFFFRNRLNKVPVPMTNMGLYDLSAQSITEMNNDNLGAYAGHMTYSGIFAIFPFLLFLLSLLAVFHATGLTHNIFSWISSFVPHSTATLIRQSMLDIAQTRAKSSFTAGAVLTLALSLWGISGGMRATIQALNVMYDTRETRPFWKVWGLSLILAFFAPITLVITIVLIAISSALLSALGIGGVALWAIVIIKWPILIGFVLLSFSALYYFGPDIEQRFKFITVGSAFATCTWLLFTVIFSFYTNNFGSFNATYGTLAGIILLLLYMYYTAYVFLLGGEINRIIEHNTGGN